MFTNEDTAFSVREHMKNALWLISATTINSPATSSSREEQLAYNKAISKVTDAIIESVLDPIRERHPNLSDRTTFQYQKYLNKKNESESEVQLDSVSIGHEENIIFKDRHLAMQVRDLLQDIAHLAHRARHIANDGNWSEEERVKFKNRLALGIDDAVAATCADIYRDHHDLVLEEQRIFYPREWFDHP